MTARELVGTWKLVSAEYRYPDGRVVEYLGPDPSGMLIYDAQGNMALQLMRRGRPAFASGDRLGGTPEEIRAAFGGYHAYFGTFTVDEEQQAVTHHIEGCSLPNWVGVNQERFYELRDDRLILRTPPLRIGGRDAAGLLTWRRASK